MPPETAAPGIVQFQQLFQRFLNLSVGIAFMLLTAALVWAGVKFITSGGDPKALASTWQIVTWAVLGIIFLVLAWLSIRLIGVFSGADIEKFCLGFAPYCILDF